MLLGRSISWEGSVGTPHEGRASDDERGQRGSDEDAGVAVEGVVEALLVAVLHGEEKTLKVEPVILQIQGTGTF